MNTMGEMHQEHVKLTHTVKQNKPPPLQVPDREGDSILGSPTAIRGSSSTTKPLGALSAQVSPVPTTPLIVDVGDPPDTGHRRNWLPKMDFPKFDGTDAQVWVDACNTYFLMYQIPEGFKVAAATMNLHDNAAHWYQSYKTTTGWHDWQKF